MPAAPPTEATIASLPVAVLELDAELRVVSAAGGALTSTGWPAALTAGRRLQDVLPADVCRVLVPRFRLALDEGRALLFDLRRGPQVWRHQTVPLPGARLRVLAELL